MNTIKIVWRGLCLTVEYSERPDHWFEDVNVVEVGINDEDIANSELFVTQLKDTDFEGEIQSEMTAALTDKEYWE